MAYTYSGGCMLFQAHARRRHSCRWPRAAVHTLDVRTGVHADATAALSQTVETFASAALAGGLRDTGVASRVAVVLMSTQYDDLSDGGYVEGHEEVIKILQVCALLTARKCRAGDCWRRAFGFADLGHTLPTQQTCVVIEAATRQ
jgi:hypothetical protein